MCEPNKKAKCGKINVTPNKQINDNKLITHKQTHINE